MEAACKRNGEKMPPVRRLCFLYPKSPQHNCRKHNNTNQEDDTMANRKRRMKLPNGFGSIKYLGSGRRNPYAAYPPATEWAENGKYQITPKALAYAETWEDAYELLTAYNMEKQGKVKINRNVLIDRTPTFSEVYDNYYKEKFFNSPKKLSESSMYSTQAAFKNCSALHNRQMGQLRYDDLQNTINSCTLKHSSIELIVSLLHQMYKYAMKYEIVDKDYSAFLYIPKEDDDESGVPFSEEELKFFWQSKEDPIIQMLLIMCYSGYRIAAFRNMETNLEERYFKGGVKTKTSKERIVPIHPAIYDFVQLRHASYGRNLIGMSTDAFRKKMYATLDKIGIQKHTPHDCRHTFSMLCEKYNVNENDRKRLMGHSFGSDLTNQKYGHRTIDDLKAEIGKIKVCY